MIASSSFFRGEAMIRMAALAAILALVGCAPGVDKMVGLPHPKRHRPPPQLTSPPPMRLPSALTDSAAVPVSPDARPAADRPQARPAPAATRRVASLPRRRWQQGAMAFHMAMGLRHRRRIPVMVLFHRPGCPYSRALDQLYLREPGFIRATGRIIKVSVNTRGSAADVALTEKQKITGTPTLLVYPGRGGRPREVIVFYRAGTQIRRKPLTQVIAEIKRYALQR
jgi:hypothetical protein